VTKLGNFLLDIYSRVRYTVSELEIDMVDNAADNSPMVNPTKELRHG